MAKNRFLSNIGSSLALRVFLVCLAFLIFPLSIYSIYLLYQEEGTRLFSHLLILIILMVTFGGATAAFLIWKMSSPLKQLQIVMKKVGLGQIHLQYHHDKWGFEINQLGVDFNQMVASLLLHMERAKKERIGREVAEQELKMGQDIQKALFPKTLPSMPEIEVGAYFAPAQKISGDFYDLFKGPNGKLLIVMADVAGKGVSACLYALLFRSTLRALISKETSLAGIIPLASHLFKLDAEESSTFVTAWIGLFDPQTKELEYGSFGHPPALLLRPNRAIQELRGADMAFGIKEFEIGKTQVLSLKEGDCLLLYTDGLIEAVNRAGKMYGKERFLQDAEAVEGNNPSDLVKELARNIEEFSGSAPPHDDLSLLALKVF